MMFKTVYIKLTLFYVLIVMIISLIFSFAIYKISIGEIGRGLGPQNRIFMDFRPNNFEELRNQQVRQSQKHLKTNLLYYNFL